MSILQIEISEEARQRLEARAAAHNLDLQSWVREYLEIDSLNEQIASPQLTQKMDEALASGDPITPDDDWWANLERGSLALRDAKEDES